MLSSRCALLLLSAAATIQALAPGDGDGDATYHSHTDADANDGDGIDGDVGVNPGMYNTVGDGDSTIQYGFIASDHMCHSATSKCWEGINLQTCVTTVHADADCGFGFSHQPNGGGGKCCCGSAVHNTWCWDRDDAVGATVYCLEGGDAGGDADMDAEDPTSAPTDAPTRKPDAAIAAFLAQVADGDATNEPTDAPTDAPTLHPTSYPTSHPTSPTTSPTRTPTKTAGTQAPTTPSPTNHHFDPSSPLVSYWERGACGPRGDDASANLTKECPHGAHVVRSAPPPNAYRTVLTVNDCEYFAYIVYECDECTGPNCNPTTNPVTSPPTSTNSPTTSAPTTEQEHMNGQVENYGVNCWTQCGGQGWCPSFCGTGLCCRWGWTKGNLNGCEGNGIQGSNFHACVPPIPTAAPSTLSPTKAPTSPTKTPSGSPTTLAPTDPIPTNNPTTPHPTTLNPTSNPTVLFDPTDTMVSYWDKGACGARGDDAQADLSSCEFGAYIVRQVLPPGSNEHSHNHGTGWTTIATYGGCDYFGYILYACHATAAPTTDSPTESTSSPTAPTGAPVTESPTEAFDPTSTLVTYWDHGACGPRGDDAQADLTQCLHGSRIVKSYNSDLSLGYNTAFTYGGCQYFAYIAYECLDPPSKSPTANPTANVVGCCRLPDPDQADGGWYIDNVYANKCSASHWQEIAASHTNWNGNIGDLVPQHFPHKSCAQVTPTLAPTGSPSTLAPTTEAWANYVGMSGDPFTTFQGKKSQMYLPLGKSTKLLQCSAVGEKDHPVELFGRTKSSGIAGDVQQWFSGFELHIAEFTIIATINTTATVKTAAVDNRSPLIDDVRNSVQRTLEKLRKAKQQDASPTQQASLSTLNVSLSLNRNNAEATSQITHPGPLPTLRGAMIGSISQDHAKPIGNGFVETLEVQTDAFNVKILSALANKFDKADDKHSFLHLDVVFGDVHATACGGVLPEIWGLRPLSKRTSQFLQPPNAE